MTIIVSVKINDGIVMASDSASTFAIGQTYLSADKIVNLVHGLPVGIMVTGSGSIGNESFATLMKDLRLRMDPGSLHDWKINRTDYTLEDIAKKVREFLFEEKARNCAEEIFMRLRVAGYSSGKPLPELWEIIILGQESPPPRIILNEDQIGINWDGYYEALDRLILGIGSQIKDAIRSFGAPDDKIDEYYMLVRNHTFVPLVIAAMPIQDAIDLSRFLVETTVNFAKFHISHQPKTVGGSVEIAAITKHEGFRWIQRRHFYPGVLNP